jgi:hypothetical protein
MDSPQFEHKAGWMERTVLSPIFWIVMIPMGLLVTQVAVQTQRGARHEHAMLSSISMVLSITVILVLPVVVGTVLGRSYALSFSIAQRAELKSGLRRRDAAQAAGSAKAERAALEEQFRSAA